LASEANTL